jgi:signal transduction histidine kinase
VSRDDADGVDLKHSKAAPAVAGENQTKSLVALLHHLSHEVRTPLQSLLTLSELLREGRAGALNPEQQKYVEVIQRNGQVLIRLVTDVLDLSRMELGQIELVIRTFDLSEQVRAIAMEFAPLAEAKGIHLSVECGRPLPLVRCDPDRARQVVTNLVENAIRFTDRGQVSLFLEPREKAIAVRVADTGIGIPEAVRVGLLDQSFHTAGVESSGRSGTGLRLAIASRLARLMGGELSVESTEGVGSRFTFTLPIGERAAQRQAVTAGDHEDPDGLMGVAEKTAGGVRVAPRSRHDQHGTNPTGR